MYKARKIETHALFSVLARKIMAREQFQESAFLFSELASLPFDLQDKGRHLQDMPPSATKASPR